jgi:hypothetical protein
MGRRHLIITVSLAGLGVGISAGSAAAAATKAGNESFSLTQSFTGEGGPVTASGGDQRDRYGCRAQPNRGSVRLRCRRDDHGHVSADRLHQSLQRARLHHDDP